MADRPQRQRCRGPVDVQNEGEMIAPSDVVGRLLRPPALVTARRAYEAGSGGAADLKRVEDSAVDSAVAMEEAPGLDVVTDGEFLRYAFYGHLIDPVDGLRRTR